eukprot:Nitzschia sp. Nitz4//scaffold130_size63480//17043//17606//NITZ4_006243-RA/size63480-processed-gene-0.78-mRNA-1//1//CDS//3329535171//7234//frame0
MMSMNRLVGRQVVPRLAATAGALPAVESVLSCHSMGAVRCKSSMSEPPSHQTSPPAEQSVFERTIYVHPLSQLVLEYLQDSHTDWVHSHGLHSSLSFQRDGSFQLRFPPDLTTPNARIWTTYDDAAKKHWLIVERGTLHRRFLLQDNCMVPWHRHRKSLPERIHSAVDCLISAIDETTSTQASQKQR